MIHLRQEYVNLLLPLEKYEPVPGDDDEEPEKQLRKVFEKYHK